MKSTMSSADRFIRLSFALLVGVFYYFRQINSTPATIFTATRFIGFARYN